MFPKRGILFEWVKPCPEADHNTDEEQADRDWPGCASRDAGPFGADIVKVFRAALLSALVQGIIAGQTASAEGPSAILARVNAAMIRRAVAARYATMFYAELHADGRLVYGNAGHNPPIVVGPGGLRRLEAGGPPVGLFEDLTYDSGEVQLLEGDRVIVFSDGVSEALNAREEEFGDNRIIAVANAAAKDPSAAGLVESLLAEVRSFAGGTAQGDDITALVVAYTQPAVS